LRAWLVEASADGENWRVVDDKVDNEELNGKQLVGTFTATGGRASRFIRLVNIGRNHARTDIIWISAWEIFGFLLD
jgi:hypothetical protein